MKKRKPSSRKQPRSLKYSPKPGENRASDSILLRSQSYQEIKRKKLSRNVNYTNKQQFHGHGDEAELNKNVFDSLESLFNVKKYLNLPEIQSLELNEADGDNSISLSPRISEILQQNLGLHLPEQIHVDHRLISKQYESEFSYPGVISNFDEQYSDHLKSPNLNMADDDNVVEEEEEIEELNEEDKAAEESGEPSAPPDAGLNGQGENADDAEISPGGAGDGAGPPDHPIPAGMAEGVEIQPGHRTESLVSSFPITDAAMMEEIAEADERCKAMQREIDALKSELNELQQKEDLTDEDRAMADAKSEQIMAKMAELEEMTRKLQRMLGITDPTSEEFARAFDMYPAGFHHPGDEAEGESALDKPGCKDLITRDDESKYKFGAYDTGELSDDDQFDLRQPEFPEDRLPRVIVCGYTENNLPKIVVADSKRKPRKDQMHHLRNITGKLSEALNIQEKLAKENAHLESNKYKLQEALLEKDNTVDVLQRKVCGLQKEMQILMRENEKLSRQLSHINERIDNQTTCCSQDNSPRSLKPVGLSTIESPRDYSGYKCCSRQRSTTPQGPSACTSPRDQNFKGNYSPRLSGGGSTEFDFNKNPKMCCRNPGMSPRSIPPLSPNRGACPAEIEDKLNTYENSTKQLEQQLGCMESEVRNMKMELANVQRERQQLEQQRKLLKCTGPCAPCPCPTSPDSASRHQSLTPGSPPGFDGNYQGSQIVSKMSPGLASSCSGICIDQPPGASNCPQQQLRDLREQYSRLQEDYKNKLCEVSCLRTDLEKLRQEARDARESREKAEIKMIDLEERLKKFESEKNKFGGSKEQMIEERHRLMVAEQRHRDALEELEELRLSNQEYLLQLEDYRNKYLRAQETVEEQSRQLDMMEMDNARMNENVTLEIGRVKNQFQEKLAELAPLPEILKQTQLKLQESQQTRAMAERNCEEIDRELLAAKDKIGALAAQLDILRSENALMKGEQGSGSGRLDELENKNSELRTENERYKNAIARFEEREQDYEEKLEHKMHEIVQLSSENEQVRQDAARQVTRTKERCETIRRAMQEQIADMEKQLAQCRAVAKAAQKDRDEIRQKMQGQINRLSESFEQAQGRIRTLQGHVNYLKTSYSNVFNVPVQGEGPIGPGPPDSDVLLNWRVTSRQQLWETGGRDLDRFVYRKQARVGFH